MTKLLLLLAASSLTLAGCGKPANPNDGSSGPAETGSASPASVPMAAAPAAAARQYVALAAAADQFEIQASELVLKQSKNADVRAFAQQMISDHGASTTKLMAAVSTLALSAPGTGLRASQQNDLAALRDAGSKLDQLYIEQQRAAHAAAIDLHEGATANADMPTALTTFANEVLPAVQTHTRMLAEMKTPAPR